MSLRRIFSLVILVSALILAGCQQSPTVWEYHIEAVPDLSFNTRMNQLGQEGWELVTARRASDGDTDNPTMSYEMIFKRSTTKKDAADDVVASSTVATYATCRANLMAIANAEMSHRVATRTGFTSDLGTIAMQFPEGLPICPAGGRYSVIVGTPANSFTVHCSESDHDAGAGGEPRGYSPGVNTK